MIERNTDAIEAGDATGADRAAAVLPRGPASRSTGPGFVARLGLVVVAPRWALTLGGDRGHAGRSGSDLILAIVLMLAATRLRGIASAIWLASAVDPGLGMRAMLPVLTGALTVDLVLLVLGALVVFALAGARRDLGRAFDLACVAALPLVLVDLVATVAVRVADLDAVPGLVSWALSALSFAWIGALIALAVRPARSASRQPPVLPVAVIRPARRLGWAIAAVVAVGVAVQASWIASNLDLVKPMTTGEPAPAFALPEIGPTGKLGPRVALAATRGKVTVLDFWATWCGPCLASMPRLEKLARAHPDVAVLAINLDDAVAARALFNRHGYTMKLLAGDDDVSQRYGVSAIPHTVLIDRHGMVSEVIRGEADLATRVDKLRAAP